jgi:PAS domain S-box-containing protein
MNNAAETLNAASVSGFRPEPQIIHHPPQFLDHLPIAIYACDADGKLCWFNRRAVTLWGRRPATGQDGEFFCGSLRRYGLNGHPIALADTPMARVLKTGVPIHGRDIVIERPDGSRIIAMVHIDPVFDTEGRLIGAINCFHDITGAKAAERQARDSERRLRDLLEALPVAVYTTDARGYLTSFNEAAAELWQHRPVLGESQWCGSWRLRTPLGEPMPHDQCPMALVLKGQSNVRGREAVLERPDGHRIPFLAFPSVLRDSAGRITGAVNMMVDISDRKRAEESQKTLVDELNHRVKNTLATVLSLASNTAREASVPAAIREALESRLIALSRTHDQLTRNGWRSADLRQLIHEILTPYSNGRDQRMAIDGPPVDLTPRQALAIAMVINELASNASRHGSLSRDSGELKIDWSVKWRRANPRLRIDWREIGTSPVGRFDRKGFGMRLIERTIESELSGAIEFHHRKSTLHGVISLSLS